MEHVDADVVAADQRQREGDRRADRERIAAELVGALQRELNSLRASVSTATMTDSARKMRAEQRRQRVSICPSGGRLRWQLRIDGAALPSGRARCAAHFSPERGADRGLPLLRAAGVDLSQTSAQAGSETLRHRAAHELDVGLASPARRRSLNFLPVVHGSLPTLQFTASWNSSSEYFQTSSVCAVERGLQLGLLVGLELVPRLQRDRVGVQRHLEADRQLVRRHLGPAGRVRRARAGDRAVDDAERQRLVRLGERQRDRRAAEPSSMNLARLWS